VFYIGGTKQGALFGEALVIVNPQFRKDFRYLIKQGGGMLAKGRLLGIQFETLFADGLYFRLAEHAVKEALRIREALREKGYELPWASETNQQFVVFENKKLEQLQSDFVFSEVSRPDESHTLVRICTSWATKTEDTDALTAAL
jgi:threonine aldolase